MDDVDEELTQIAIRHALKQHGYYFETIEPNDGTRAEQLGRLGRTAATQARRRGEHGRKAATNDEIQVCMCIVRSPRTTREPA
jgi:hypothetical protein